MQALEFVRDYGELTEEQLGRLHGRFITTLRRLLETPDVRNELGLDLTKQQLFSFVPAEEVVKGLRRVVLDLAEKRYTVTQLKTKAQMVAYVLGLGKKDKPDLSKTIAPVPLDELGPSSDPSASSPGSPGPGSSGPGSPGSGGSPGGVPKPRSRPTPPRLSVVPKPYRLRVTNAKALEIYEELKTLLLAKHRHAISVMLRVFLEISVDHHLVSIGSRTTYFEPKGKREVDKKLKAKVEESVEFLIKQGAPKKEFASVLKALTSTTHPLSPDLLHSYVHNRFSTPMQGDLTAAWDNAQPLLERIWQ